MSETIVVVEQASSQNISVNISPDTAAIEVNVVTTETPETTVVLSNDQGPQGIVGEPGIVSQTSAPSNTDILWLDTDEPAATPDIITSLPSIVGNYHTPPGVVCSGISGAATTNQSTYYIPFLVVKTLTYTGISIKTGNTFSGTSSVRLGIYNESGSGTPSTVLLDAGTVSCTAASTIYTITISQSLTPGIYWLAFCQQTAPTTGTYITYVATNPNTLLNSTQSAFNATRWNALMQSGVTGAFATANWTGGSSSAPMAIMLQG